MARDDRKKDDKGKGKDEDEKDNEEAGVSDEALELLDEDEDDPLLAVEPEDDKGWE